MKRELTDKQAAVLRFIKDRQRENQSSPTVKEIAEGFGWASPNAAWCHLTALRSKGWITIMPGKARNIFVL